MDIRDIKVLKGPNYWSQYRHKLIQLKLDLGELNEILTSQIPDFNQELIRLLPTLAEHRCYSQYPGGFIKKLSSGTMLGHVLEHVALELQWIVGMRCGFGRARQTYETGIYYIVFSYEFEQAGIYAAKASLRLIHSLAKGQPYAKISEDLRALNEIKEKEKFGPSTEAIIREAEKRDIPWLRLDDNSLIQLGQGRHQKIIRATETGNTSCIGSDHAKDKEITKRILKEACLPTPRGFITDSVNDLEYLLKELNYPVVIKPRDGHHGLGITSKVNSIHEAIDAFYAAQNVSESVLLEQEIAGNDYRFLVVDYKVVAVAQREPAQITGDGKTSIRNLIQYENKNPFRGIGHLKPLTCIEIDEVTRSILRHEGLSLDSILKRGRRLRLKYTANLSTGGTAMDVTDLVHPDNIFMIERAARHLLLDVCGIDVISQDIAVPFSENYGAIIEINSGPGLRMHLYPTVGRPRNVAKPIIDMLFKESLTGRIPIISVTGTNGKTTVVRLIAHILRLKNYNVGFTTTDGIYINQQQIAHGDCSGPKSARTVLREPLVDYAVFECARGGILREGLGFDYCDISVLTNISEDHLDLEGIHTLEDLTRVKATVSHSTKKHGYAILNADDNRVYAIMDELQCNIALFSVSINERIKKHMKQGGLVSFIEDGKLMIASGQIKAPIIDIQAIPLTFSGKASCMVKNVLPAAIVGKAIGLSNAEIAKSLITFEAKAETIPGRMNWFRFKDFDILLDYAHNPEAYRELKQYLNQLHYSKKVGIIAATGDRRDIDITNLGRAVAEIFDEIIIRSDENTRGRTRENMAALLLAGINEVSSEKHKMTKIIPHELDAIQYAIDTALSNSLIYYFPDNIENAIKYINLKLK